MVREANIEVRSGYDTSIPTQRYSMKYRVMGQHPEIKRTIHELKAERGPLVFYECGIGEKIKRTKDIDSEDADKVGALEFINAVGAENFSKIILQDASPEAIQKLREDIDLHYPELKDKIDIREGILKAGETEEADVVISNAVLEHMSEPETKLEHIQSLVNKTKQGGLLYLDNWEHNPWRLKEMAKTIKIPREVDQIEQVGKINHGEGEKEGYWKFSTFIYKKKEARRTKKRI